MASCAVCVGVPDHERHAAVPAARERRSRARRAATEPGQLETRLTPRQATATEEAAGQAHPVVHTAEKGREQTMT